MNIKFQKINKKRAFLLLFLAALLFRLPTLFNDYYDVDELSAIVQTHEYFAGGIPDVDFKESKLPLYHAIFKLSYYLSPGHGWIIVHAITILIVFFTSLYIYKIAARLKDSHTGLLAAFLYSILISSFNRHFLATNAEIVFNLPVTAGLYYLICYLSNKNKGRFITIIYALLMGVAAAAVKYHGRILLLFMIFFFILYSPYYKKAINKKFIGRLSVFVIISALLFIIDYNFTGLIAPEAAKSIKKKIFYVTAKSTDPFYFFIRYIHRQGMLMLWHAVLWLPAVVLLKNFIKNRFRMDTLEESAVAAFFLSVYAMILAGGARLYFHYFMAVYPVLAVIASIELQNPRHRISAFINKKLAVFILVPSIFFLAWNTKDVIIKHYFPGGFYNEGRALYWTRAVLTGQFNDYLLPHASYKEVCEYIKEHTSKDDSIFVWGDGAYLYYFSERRMGIYHLWPKTKIIKINRLYKKDNPASIKKAEGYENDFIEDLRDKKPELFIDTSGNGLSNFHYPVTPLVRKFIGSHYTFEKEISGMKIYRIDNR